MLSTLYTNYFDKDKPLRHPSQHLIFAFLGLSVTYLLFHLHISSTNFLIFILFSYIPDIDGLLSLFIEYKRIPEAKEILQNVRALKFKTAAILATTHHKKFNRLLIHNIVGLMVVVMAYIYFGVSKNFIFLSISGAILTHFILDIGDDIYQLGHIKNWFWFLKPT